MFGKWSYRGMLCKGPRPRHGRRPSGLIPPPGACAGIPATILCTARPFLCRFVSLSGRSSRRPEVWVTSLFRRNGAVAR
jgi:hypothetical protein